eukprot:scaffold22754_cov68-Phaeocystis_antarctica.AAC.1
MTAGIPGNTGGRPGIPAGNPPTAGDRLGAPEPLLEEACSDTFEMQGFQASRLLPLHFWS